MQVNLNDVISAIVDADEDNTALYDPANQEIVWEGENDDLIPLPGREERGDYRNMEHFVETVEDEEAQEWLNNAIKGKGAFRRFRAACEKFHLLEDWYDYDDRAHKALAVQWCEDNGIVWNDNGPAAEEDEDDVSDFLHEDYSAPEAEEPVKEAAPSLIRIVEITERNAANALYITDAYLQTVYHGSSDLEYAETQLKMWLRYGCRVIAASDHGRFVGIAVGKEDMEDFVIKAVYVMEDHRRQGIGRQMLQYLEENNAEAASYKLACSDRLACAAPFFASAGFTAVSDVVMHKIPKDK